MTFIVPFDSQLQCSLLNNLSHYQTTKHFVDFFLVFSFTCTLFGERASVVMYFGCMLVCGCVGLSKGRHECKKIQIATDCVPSSPVTCVDKPLTLCKSMICWLELVFAKQHPRYLYQHSKIIYGNYNSPRKITLIILPIL